MSRGVEKIFGGCAGFGRSSVVCGKAEGGRFWVFEGFGAELEGPAGGGKPHQDAGALQGKVWDCFFRK